MIRVRIGLLLGMAALLIVAGGLAWQHAAAVPVVQDGKDDSADTEVGADVPPDPLWQKVDAMSLSEQVGQLVVVGLDGTSINDNARTLINGYDVGGFILYEPNVRDAGQLLQLLNDLKSANSGNRAPLFLSVDEEGGRVSRMPSGLLKLPTNSVIGAKDDADLSTDIGKVIAAELQAFGFNMDFAPVLDINSNPKNPVIGDRSFGPGSDAVARLGTATMKGLQDGGVIPVVKHFPGHGDTSVDSHLELPVVNKSLQELQDFELVPFRTAVDNGADAVMVAHILLPQLDPQNPSSLSSAIMTDLLRQQLDFRGVIITDDLTMGAITDSYGLGSAAVQSILAGADIALVAHGYDNAVTALTALRQAVESGRIPESRVRESVYRILKLKEKYGLSDTPVHSIDVAGLNKQLDSVLEAIRQK